MTPPQRFRRKATGEIVEARRHDGTCCCDWFIVEAFKFLTNEQFAQIYEPVPESHAESQCPCLPMRIGCGCPCHVGPTSLAAIQAAVWEETDNYLHVCEERITYAQRAPDFEIRARLNELLLAVQDLRQRRKALIEALRREKKP